MNYIFLLLLLLSTYLSQFLLVSLCESELCRHGSLGDAVGRGQHLSGLGQTVCGT